MHAFRSVPNLKLLKIKWTSNHELLLLLRTLYISHCVIKGRERRKNTNFPSSRPNAYILLIFMSINCIIYFSFLFYLLFCFLYLFVLAVKIWYWNCFLDLAYDVLFSLLREKEVYVLHFLSILHSLVKTSQYLG